MQKERKQFMPLTPDLDDRMRHDLGFVIPQLMPSGSYNAVVDEVIDQIEAGPLQFDWRWFTSGEDERSSNEPATVATFNARETMMFKLARQANVRIALCDTAPTYSPRFDVIHLPAPEYVFGSDDIPAAVVFQIAGFHEMIHWTGNKNRLRRFK
jgi:zincin-like metallopeptidase